MLGTYSATVTDSGTGDNGDERARTSSAARPGRTAQRSAAVQPGALQLEAEQCAALRGEAPQDTPVPPDDQLQCNPPRSQLEAEQCAGVDMTRLFGDRESLYGRSLDFLLDFRGVQADRFTVKSQEALAAAQRLGLGAPQHPR